MEGKWDDLMVVVLAGAVALRGFTYRDAIGNHPWLWLLFGFVALQFGLRELLGDVLDVW